MSREEPVLVTKSTMPPLQEVVKLLEGVWERAYLTNNGPLLQQFERLIAARNGVADAVAVANGTLAIELLLEAFDIKGEVITTPFTFPATATAICRAGAEPVFVDIDPETWNIDPQAVERAITPNTTAILGVHVFGRPCDVRRLERIAKTNHLRLIYDAAHANFVRTQGKSIFEWGDASSVSFHATKLFHTSEGGACFSPDPEIRAKIRRLRNFGYGANARLTEVGTNAKMMEFAAAVGIVNLRRVDSVIESRRRLYRLYKERLAGIDSLAFQKIDGDETNFGYFPVVFPSEEILLRVIQELNQKNIFPRRYFWPLLSDMTPFAEASSSSLAVAKTVSSRIVCLPFYPDMGEDVVGEICDTIRQFVSPAALSNGNSFLAKC